MLRALGTCSDFRLWDSDLPGWRCSHATSPDYSTTVSERPMPRGIPLPCHPDACSLTPDDGPRSTPRRTPRSGLRTSVTGNYQDIGNTLSTWRCEYVLVGSWAERRPT